MSIGKLPISAGDLGLKVAASRFFRRHSHEAPLNNDASTIDASERSEFTASEQPPYTKEISAEDLRQILLYYEEDKRRDECEPSLGSKIAPLGKDRQTSYCSGEYGITVSRTGVKIEKAVIAGYLNLSGLQFPRPLIFSQCRFTHSVNLSNARLGPVSFTNCVFDPAPSEHEAAIKRYAGPRHESNGSTSIGYLPPRMMVAQGINAQGAMFDGYVDLTGVRAQRLEFPDARFENSVDLQDAEIRHPPYFNALIADEEKWDDAVDFTSARGQFLLVDAAIIVGCVNLTEASFSGVYFTQSYLCALVQPHGSRGLSVTGRALNVKSDLWVRCNVGARGEGANGKQPNVLGRLSFENAEIGGEVRFEGISIALGLSEKHRRILAKHENEIGLARSERHVMRAISLRNCVVDGSVHITKYEPRLEEVIPTESRGDAHLHAQDRHFYCDGEIHLKGISVKGDVWFEGCRVVNRTLARAIDLRDASILGTLAFKNIEKKSEGVIDLRGAKTQTYRDDFDYLQGPSILGGINIFRYLNELKHAILSSLALLPVAALFLLTLGLYGREDLWSRLIRRDWRSQVVAGWPRRLQFRLMGFSYGSFPIREAPGAINNSDSARMPLTREARLRWLKHQESIWLTTKFQPQPWIQCARILSELGYDRQAHILLVRREKLAMGSADVGVLEKIVRWLLVISCGHGHAMWRLIPIGFVTFIGALAINTIAIKSNLVRPANTVIVASEAYQLRGEVPINYSALNPLSFTLQNMFPLPPIGGGSEWRACNWSQIRSAVKSASAAACVPRMCSISERRNCERLPVVLVSNGSRPGLELGLRYLRGDCNNVLNDNFMDLRTGNERGLVFSNVICASPSEVESLLASPVARGLEKGLGGLAAYYTVITNFAIRVINQSSAFSGIELRSIKAHPFVLRDTLNIAVAGGLAAITNAIAAFVGWGILLLVGTYAVGTLKRRE